MNGKKLALTIVVLSCVSAAQVRAGGAQSGNILKLGAGSKAAAMSEAFTAASNEPSVMFYNPAGLARQKDSSFMAMHALWFESVGYSVAAYNRPFAGIGVFGLGLQMLNYGSIDSNNNTGVSDGTFTPRDIVASLAWGCELGGDFSVGAAAKYLSTRIDNTASAFLADAGLQYRRSGLTAGLAFQNVGTKLKFNKVSESVSRQSRLGLAYDYRSFTFYGDANLPSDADAWYAAGAEYRLVTAGKMRAAFRAGYSTRSGEARNDKTFPFSFGLGLGVDSYDLDYAFVPYGDLGQAHHITLNIRWGSNSSTSQERPTSKEPAVSADMNHGAVKSEEIPVVSTPAAAVAIGQAAVTPEIKGLLAFLKDPDWKQRRGAAFDLGKMKAVEAVAPLLELLNDENEKVRSSAAMALGRIGDKQALEPLIKKLADESAEVRALAAKALGNLGDNSAVNALKNVLRDRSAQVRNAVAAALNKLQP